MGERRDTGADKWEHPVHLRPFRISSHCVTIAQYAQFDWDSGRTLGATYRPPVAVHAPGFGMERDWETRFQQYDINHNDRARYTPGCTLDGSCPVNFKAEMPGGGQLPVGIPQG